MGTGSGSGPGAGRTWAPPRGGADAASRARAAAPGSAAAAAAAGPVRVRARRSPAGASAEPAPAAPAPPWWRRRPRGQGRCGGPSWCPRSSRWTSTISRGPRRRPAWRGCCGPRSGAQVPGPGAAGAGGGAPGRGGRGRGNNSAGRRGAPGLGPAAPGLRASCSARAVDFARRAAGARWGWGRRPRSAPGPGRPGAQVSGAGSPGRALHALPPLKHSHHAPARTPASPRPRSRDPQPASALPALRAAREPLLSPPWPRPAAGSCDLLPHFA